MLDRPDVVEAVTVTRAEQDQLEGKTAKKSY